MDTSENITAELADHVADSFSPRAAMRACRRTHAETQS